jgi:lysophospholipase L1-like esterase
LKHLILCAAAVLSLAPALPSTAAPPSEKFELRDGDRVALLGNTFFEREQSHSYLETLLITRHPDRNATFRNIAWSGDTVFGHARAAFDTPVQGFERLVKVAHDVKPTVLFISYGMGESFDGDAGLSTFRAGLGRMLDRLADLKARTVLISPIRHENLGPPWPNPDRHNADLRKYTEVLKQAADERGFWFVDLYELMGDGMQNQPSYPYTDNGVHLTAYGYWRAARAIERGLGDGPRGWTITLEAAAGSAQGKGVQASAKKDGKAIELTIVNDLLPAPPPPPIDARYIAPDPASKRTIVAKGLPEGHWILRAGDAVLAAGSSDEWEKGIDVVNDPLSQQVEQLRQVAVLKNMQFFNQWRPANETYIFGFRRNEQGQNAREMPMFDEPIAQKEAEMAKLRAAPKSYTLRIQKENE